MTEVESTSSPAELLSTGRRHLAVKDYHAAVEALAIACEQLAKEHGDMADQCAEAYLWYGKALLGLSREETGVLGEGVPGTGNDHDDEDDDEEENGEEESNEATAEKNEEATAAEKPVSAETSNGESSKVEKNEAESTTKDEEESKAGGVSEQAGPSNGEPTDESAVNLDEDDVDNLQLAWEMLDLARSILDRRVESSGGDAARALLADAHLALGEVALESETYDKAVRDMQSCLEIQKGLYRSDDRRIAETHYQIGLANSLASNFEDAITHFKNAVNILETRIKTLESPTASDDASVKKSTVSDPGYTVEGEIKELKEVLPEIQEKIQDMMDYKAETIKRIRESLLPSNGSNESPFSNGAGSSSSTAGASTLQPKRAPSDISHLIKRKRKSSTDAEEGTAAKKPST